MQWPQLAPAVLAGFLDVAVPTVVDRLDYVHGIRSWMQPAVKPLERRRIVGQAVTILMEPARGRATSLDSFFAGVDACGPGRILCIANGGDPATSCMGDLVAAALVAKGAEGVVMDGAVRDIAPILEMGLAVVAAGVSPVSFAEKMTVIGHDIPVQCGGAGVRPGDVLLADWDGVVVIPVEIAEAVLEQSRRVEASEVDLREQILREAARRPIADIFAEHE